MTESEARAILREQGITNPSRQLVENWLRVQEHETHSSPHSHGPSPVETQGQPETRLASAPDAHPRRFASVEQEQAQEHPSSESNLEPLLRERGQLERPAGPRKAGRPQILAPWFQALAVAMSDGTPLREALARCGVHGLTQREIRALYRNRALKVMREEARQKWLREWGIRPKRPTVRPKGCRGADCLGMSPELLREL
jgi:hypothetical protein